MESKRKVGRPKSNDSLPDGWEEIITDAGKEGKHITDFLITLGIDWEQHYRMMERKPEYSKIVNRYKKYCENFWYEMARQEMVETGGASFNSRLWSLIVRNKFPENWSESTKMDVVSNGQTLEQTKPITIEIIKPKQD
jgi:hypothetical protein